jgi:membrane AbrB-like protein
MFDLRHSPLVAVLICGTGGAIFYLLHLPLPWMLGSLTAAGVTASLGGQWVMPAFLRSVARPVIGVLVGSTFTAGTFAAMAHWWDSVLVVLATSTVLTVAGYGFFRRIGGFDRETALLSASPAGVTEMALLATSLGASTRDIVVTHLMRILVVIFVVPFVAQLVIGHPIGRVLPTFAANAPTLWDWGVLTACTIIGYALSRVVKVPAGLMIIPMMVSAAAHAGGLTQASPPGWLVAFMQVVIGGIVGSQFAGLRWRAMHRTLFAGLIWAALLVAFAIMVAWLTAPLVEQSFLSMLLAVAPAGTIEMTILAFSIGFDVVFVVTCQIARIVFVLALSPLVLRLVSRNGPGSGPT